MQTRNQHGKQNDVISKSNTLWPVKVGKEYSRKLVPCFPVVFSFPALTCHKRLSFIIIIVSSVQKYLWGIDPRQHIASPGPQSSIILKSLGDGMTLLYWIIKHNSIQNSRFWFWFQTAWNTLPDLQYHTSSSSEFFLYNLFLVKGLSYLVFSSATC